MRRALLSFLSTLLILLSCSQAHAAEPLFKKDDVVALVGGEDMVVAGESGYLEASLIEACPDLHLRFRNLAWEGDTVFEQRRDLNFPILEEQLDKVGATVVIAQFGTMECLAGTEKLPEFVAAYSTLAERMSGGGKRRLILIPPFALERGKPPTRTPRTVEIDGRLRQIMAKDYGHKPQFRHPNPQSCSAYAAAVAELASKLKATSIDGEKVEAISEDTSMTRDGVHLNPWGQILAMGQIAALLLPDSTMAGDWAAGKKMPIADELQALIIAKNRLWFNYWRVQNWAFLAGDRTSQPSSRDDKDPSIRWFPPEREKFLPLVDAKEKEIDALAGKLGKP